MPRTREPDGWYSWLLAFVGGIALIFTLGTPFSYGIFVGPLSDQYALSEFSISIIFSVHLFASYSVAGVIAVVATRFSAKLLLIGIGCVTVLLAPMLYLVESFVGLLVVFFVLGSALGSAVIVIVSVVPQWFEENRGFATGILFVGIGLSLFVLPPAWNRAFTDFGVPSGFLVIIGTSAASFFAAGAVCRYPPWLSRAKVPFAALKTWIRRLVRTAQFHYLIFGFGFAFAWFYLLAGYSVNYFEYRGLDRAAASFAFGLIGGISVFSRLASGAIADRIGYGQTYILSLLCAAIGCGLLLLPQLAAVYLAIVFFGISLGGVTTLYVPIALRIYDPDKSTAIIGIFSIGLGISALAAPPVATQLVGYTGSFLPAIILTLVSVLAAILLVWLGTQPDRAVA